VGNGVAPAPSSYSFGPYRLDTSRRTLEKSGTPVLLSARAYDILQALIEARDRVLSRDELMARVWPGIVVETSNLTVQMSALRRALGDTGDEPGLIATIPGRGYRFVGPINDTAPPATPPAATPVTGPLPAVPPLAAAPRPRFGRIAASLAFATILACALGAWWQIRRTWPPAPPKLSIVVMPFRNLSDTGANTYLADAISDDLTTDLAHIPGSLVIARESADFYKGKTLPVEQIGRALNVRYLLEGSLRAEGGTMRVNAQLIDTANGTHIWAQRFDISTTRLWDAQTDIVHRIASGLDAALVNAEIARAARERPNDPDALDLFFHARSIIDRANTLADMVQAQTYLERAIAKEPDFTDALATLGWLLVRKEQGFEYPTEAADDAEANRVIAHALTLAPHNPSVLAASGRLLASDGRCAEARAAFDTVLTADPNNVQALWGQALCAWRLGEPEKVGPLLQATLRIDPLGPAMSRRYQLLGLAALFAGHPDQALPYLLRADAESGTPPADVDNPTQPEMTRVFLIATYALSGNLPEARRRYEAYRATWPRRSIWRHAGFLTPAQNHVPFFPKIENALAAAGMPRYGNSETCVQAPALRTPLEGGEFTATPLAVPNAQTITTEDVRHRLAANPPPLILDAGRGIALPHGALLLSDIDAPSNANPLDTPSLRARLKAAPAIIVMDTGCSGTDGYNTALHLAASFATILWYRGGEEAWAEAGLPADDRRGP
jgi:TolB-like protein/DNA-binding winged helix-turn-helix (wHTH) protein/tetratricopeptide (TPR) repeat protein